MYVIKYVPIVNDSVVISVTYWPPALSVCFHVKVDFLSQSKLMQSAGLETL